MNSVSATERLVPSTGSGSRLLQGYRTRPAADLATVQLTLVRLSQPVVYRGGGRPTRHSIPLFLSICLGYSQSDM